jgi:L-lactate permease
MGKMIDAQSVVVVGAATQQIDRVAANFRAVIRHSLVRTAIVGIIVSAYAFLVTAWVSVVSRP